MHDVNFKDQKVLDCECGSVVQHFPSIPNALGLTPKTMKGGGAGNKTKQWQYQMLGRKLKKEPCHHCWWE